MAYSFENGAVKTGRVSSSKRIEMKTKNVHTAPLSFLSNFLFKKTLLLHTAPFSFLSNFLFKKTLVLHIAPFSNEHAMKKIGVYIAPAKRCC